MHKFDYSFLEEMSISTDFATRLANIEGYKTKSKTFVSSNPQIADDMVELAILISTIDSNAIEGIRTTEERVIGLLSGKVKPKGHNEFELLGYKDALRKIHENPEMEISEKTILELFDTLVSYTGTPGGFKKRNNSIIERNADGVVTKVFPTVPHEDVDNCMFQLLAAFEEARNDLSINNILLIPCFIRDFLNIHPFIDGNGRMSRLLTTLLLYQEGYDVCAYISLESIINSSKKDYYGALAISGEGWFDNRSDYLPFIEYFIGTLFLAYREFDKRMIACSGKGNKKERITNIIINSSLPISKSEICSLINGVSETYVELILSELLKEGKIKKIGKVRSTRYIHT